MQYSFLQNNILSRLCCLPRPSIYNLHLPGTAASRADMDPANPPMAPGFRLNLAEEVPPRDPCAERGSPAAAILEKSWWLDVVWRINPCVRQAGQVIIHKISNIWKSSGRDVFRVRSNLHIVQGTVESTQTTEQVMVRSSSDILI